MFVAIALLLIATLVAAPSVSGAKPASVKQFTASISGGAGGSLTMAVTNCGGPPPLDPPCTASSTIALGSVRISFGTPPSNLAPDSSAPPVTSPDGRIWTASYNSTTGILEAHAVGGNDKLQPGEVALITWHFDSAATTCATQAFSTAAWGSIAISGSDPFTLVGGPPTVACVGSGDTVTGPGGQTETVSGDFEGTLIVTFGGDLDCSFDPTFGLQWSDFNLPNQVNITPGPGFVAGDDPKISTSRFPTEGSDSSLYLICWAGLDTFDTRSGFPPQVVEIGGTNFFVGILPNCYDPISGLTRPEPCVSEQFLDVTTTPNQIVISVRMPPEDPHKR